MRQNSYRLRIPVVILRCFTDIVKNLAVITVTCFQFSLFALAGNIMLTLHLCFISCCVIVYVGYSICIFKLLEGTENYQDCREVFRYKPGGRKYDV